MGLKLSKKNTDDILANKTVIIEIKDEAVVKEFVNDAEKLGVEFDIIKNEYN